MAGGTTLDAMTAYRNAMKMAQQSARQDVAHMQQPNSANEVKPDFFEMLNKTAEDAMNTQYRGEAAGIASLDNKVSPADLAIAVNNAELTLRTVTSLRDRLIGAYQDIIKMPV